MVEEAILIATREAAEWRQEMAVHATAEEAAQVAAAPEVEAALVRREAGRPSPGMKLK